MHVPLAMPISDINVSLTAQEIVVSLSHRHPPACAGARRVPTICYVKGEYQMAQNSNVLKGFDVAAVILLIIGALNWGLVGLFGFNLVAALFGEMSAISRLIYVLVGISALYRLFLWRDVPRRLGGCAPAPRSI
jgi:uncharacterized membrane protein YuzA (DUF378 family)